MEISVNRFTDDRPRLRYEKFISSGGSAPQTKVRIRPTLFLCYCFVT